MLKGFCFGVEREGREEGWCRLARAVWVVVECVECGVVDWGVALITHCFHVTPSTQVAHLRTSVVALAPTQDQTKVGVGMGLVERAGKGVEARTGAWIGVNAFTLQEPEEEQSDSVEDSEEEGTDSKQEESEDEDVGGGEGMEAEEEGVEAEKEGVAEEEGVVAEAMVATEMCVSGISTTNSGGVVASVEEVGKLPPLLVNKVGKDTWGVAGKRWGRSKPAKGGGRGKPAGARPVH